MQDVLLHKADPSDSSNVVIVVLGFFGIFSFFRNNEKKAREKLMKKYGHLGERFGKDVVGVTFPWTLMYAEKSMRRWVESRLDSYFNVHTEKKSIVLLVSSGGGTVMFYHFMNWFKGNARLNLKGAMWEYCPGSISIPEYFRAASATINPKNNYLLRILLFPLLYPLIIVSCEACDMLTDYSSRVRNAPWSPELIPDSVVEYSLANYDDPIMYYDYVLRWVNEMNSLGRKINHYPFKVKGHLNAMRAKPTRYLEILGQFMDEACES